MPFKSQAQRSYLFATNPTLAKEFQKETKKNNLPKYAKKEKKKK